MNQIIKRWSRHEVINPHGSWKKADPMRLERVDTNEGLPRSGLAGHHTKVQKEKPVQTSRSTDIRKSSLPLVHPRCNFGNFDKVDRQLHHPRKASGYNMTRNPQVALWKYSVASHLQVLIEQNVNDISALSVGGRHRTAVTIEFSKTDVKTLRDLDGRTYNTIHSEWVR